MHCCLLAFLLKKSKTTNFVGGALEGLSSSAKIFVATNHPHMLSASDDRKFVKMEQSFLPVQLGPTSEEKKTLARSEKKIEVCNHFLQRLA